MLGVNLASLCVYNGVGLIWIGSDSVRHSVRGMKIDGGNRAGEQVPLTRMSVHPYTAAKAKWGHLSFMKYLSDKRESVDKSDCIEVDDLSLAIASAVAYLQKCEDKEMDDYGCYREMVKHISAKEEQIDELAQTCLAERKARTALEKRVAQLEAELAAKK